MGSQGHYSAYADENGSFWEGQSLQQLSEESSVISVEQDALSGKFSMLCIEECLCVCVCVCVCVHVC